MYNFSHRRARLRPDPLRSYNFVCWIGDLGEFPHLESGINVEDVSLPFPGVEAEASYRSGSENYFAGIRKIDNIQFTFFVDETLGVLDDLMRWKDLIQDEFGFYSPAIDYKRNILIALLDSQRNTIAHIKYWGCFPSKIQNIPMTYLESQNPKIKIPFSADEVTTEYFSA